MKFNNNQNEIDVKDNYNDLNSKNIRVNKLKKKNEKKLKYDQHNEKVFDENNEIENKDLKSDDF